MRSQPQVRYMPMITKGTIPDYRNSSCDYKHLVNVLTSVPLWKTRLAGQSFGYHFFDAPAFEPNHSMTTPRKRVIVSGNHRRQLMFLM